MTELFMIDANVTDLTKLYLRPGLVSINLHCNRISRIEGISHLKQLRHLNLSSNQIERISGLNGLSQLKTLNLSCNLIVSIEGLKDLT
jgi:Leucine-rich repeat (LRR) protein